MKDALKGLFGSKKALTGIAAALTTALILFAQKQGYGLDPDATKLLIGAVLGLAGTFIVGQGAADWGKEAAKIQEAAAKLHMTGYHPQETASEPDGAPEVEVLTE